MNICIDFDGTCTTHDFPRIGKDIGAQEVLRELVANGHNLILWTMRSDDFPGPLGDDGKYLTYAVNWFIDNQIPLWGIQRNPEQDSWTTSPKAYAGLFIDDAALGCPLKYDANMSHRPFVDWVKVREMLVDMKLIIE